MSPSTERRRSQLAGSGKAPGRGAPGGPSWYAIWREVGALVILFAFLTLVFYVVEVVPGDPTRTLLPRCNPSNPGPCSFRSTIIQEWGLDKPLIDRFVIFLTNILTGNLGLSITYRPGARVWDLVASALPTTLVFVAVTMVVLAVLSLSLGSGMCRRRGGLLDLIASFLLALPFAVPAAMLGLVSIYLFAYTFKVVPVTLQSANDLWFYVLPELVILGTGVGLYAWVVRDHPLRPEADLRPPPPGDWRSPKRTAPARVVGTIPRFVAAVPILLAWTLGWEMLVEPVFGINGLGLLLWNALLRLDVPVLMGVVVVVVALVLIPTLYVADVLHYWMTAWWDRTDAVHVDGLGVDARDPVRGLRRILTSPLGLAGVALILALVIMSVAAPLLVGPYPTFGTSVPSMPPSPQHPLGTDAYGRDLLTILVYGGQPGIAIAIFGFALALIAELGMIAGIGFFGERAAVVLVLPVDLFLVLSIPFAILLVAVAGRDSAAWVPALVGWPIAVRLLLLETTGMMSVSRERPGLKPSIHERGNRAVNLVWGTVPLILADAFLAISLSILTWATFGFLGLGSLGAGTVESWGQVVYDAYVNLALLRGMWWYFVPPILCIFLAVLGPALLSLQLKRIALQTPRNAVPVDAAPRVVSALAARP